MGQQLNLFTEERLKIAEQFKKEVFEQMGINLNKKYKQRSCKKKY